MRFLSPIHKSVRQIGLYLAPRLADLGVSNQEGHLMTFLGRYDGRSMGELTRVFGMKPSSLTSMVDRLAARGWVRRELSPTDRRSFEVWLTTEGRVVSQRVRRILDDLEARLELAVGKRDYAAFQRVMTAIDDVTNVEVRRAEPRPKPEPKAVHKP